MLSVLVMSGGFLEGAFWAAAAVFVYVYLGYPLLLALIAAFHRRNAPEPGYCPRMTVLIAAYNEEAHIGRKLEQTLALEYPPDKLEILVVSDGSTDRTDAIAQTFTSDPRLRVLRVEGRRGKTHAQNEGVKVATGEIIVFSDATAVYHKSALMYLACNYRDPRIGAVSGRYYYFDPEGESPTGAGSAAFWNYENLIKSLQSRIRTLTGCSGCIYSVRKSVYTPLPDASCSDLVEPLCVVRNGFRVRFEQRAVAYEETTKTTTDEFAMRVRVVTRGIRGVLSVRELLKIWKYGWVSFQLFSHKVLRWLAPLCLVLLFVTSAALAAHPVYGTLFTLQVLFYTVGALSFFVPFHRRWKPLALPLYFCTLNLAALLGLLEVIRGQRYVVWETVRK